MSERRQGSAFRPGDLKAAFKRFQSDQITDNAAALTYYSLLSLFPALLFAVIFLLSYLPSMIRGQRYVPAEAWRDEPEWFGGPSRGSDAAEPAAGEDRETGGASARW